MGRGCGIAEFFVGNTRNPTARRLFPQVSVTSGPGGPGGTGARFADALIVVLESMRTFVTTLAGAAFAVGLAQPAVARGQAPADATPAPSAAAASPDERTRSPFDRAVAEGGRIYSMGQPPTLKWVASVSFDDRNNAALGALGLEKDVGHPLAGILAVRGEVVGGGGLDGAEGGLRLLAVSPLARLHTGLDYDARRGRVDWVVGTDFNIKRAGVFGYGSRVRFDWLPQRDQTL
jgi:hypothetical protein